MESTNLICAPSDGEEDAYFETKSRRTKRRKTNTGKATTIKNRATRAQTSLSGLLDLFRHGLVIRQAPGTETEIGNESRQESEHRHESHGFESTMEGLLAECLEARQVLWAKTSNTMFSEDNGGVGKGEGEIEVLRSLSRFEAARIIALAKHRTVGPAMFPSDRVALRKLQLYQERRRACTRESSSLEIITPTALVPLDFPPSSPAPHVVLDALQAIHTTLYECSFAARVYGHAPQKTQGLIAVDWESRAPWVLLMDDIHDHYALAHSEKDLPDRPRRAVTYVSLQPSHLRQVHELLTRVFWDGIDVSDALHYAPERCTVIAMFGHLVVGAAFLSSPHETYITYLAVRPGWDNAQIATTMLYHLIALHPHRDITLHVSANNPAMLLYNRFGFKAEEFIAGFYEAYLDSRSRVSKNAFRLRLRR